jgi:hypothetical protein
VSVSVTITPLVEPDFEAPEAGPEDEEEGFCVDSPPFSGVSVAGIEGAVVLIVQAASESAKAKPTSLVIMPSSEQL